MEQKIIHTIVALMTIVGSATAQTLSIEPIEAEVSEQAELVVSAGGMSNVTALQFNLALPDGVTLNETGISTGTAASNHSYEVRSLDSGERLIVIFDLNLGSIQNGELLILPVTLGTAEGTFRGSLSTVRFSDTDAVSKEGDGTSFTITAKRPEPPVTITANNLTMVYGDEDLQNRGSSSRRNSEPYNHCNQDFGCWHLSHQRGRWQCDKHQDNLRCRYTDHHESTADGWREERDNYRGRCHPGIHADL